MLSIIPTPIWNKDDITVRALKLFEELEIFFSEDTRTTRHLFKLYDIDARTKKIYPLTSFTHEGRLESYIELLQNNNCGLVSEAGTPGLSDPGKNLIKLCWERKVPFEVLPGANALIPAVVGSYTDTTSFTYMGFLPTKKGKETKMKEIIASKEPVFVFESVHRIEKNLLALQKLGFTWNVYIHRELTKMFEQKEHGTIDEILAKIKKGEIPMKGEFVVGFSQIEKPETVKTKKY